MKSKKNNVAAIVLAAGEGKRMHSATAKVLHCVGGVPMIDHVLDAVRAADIERIILVTGNKEDQVRKHLKGRAEFVSQKEQRGTGHAVMMTEPLLRKFGGLVLVIYGDTPLWKADTIRGAIERARQPHVSGVVITTRLEDPTGYGRIIRDGEGKLQKIVEQKDATKEEALVHEINSGTICLKSKLLFDALKHVKSNNAQREYYLTDVIGILIGRGHFIDAYLIPDHAEAMGVNSRAELARAEEALQRRTLEALMESGVTVVHPQSTWIGSRARIGRDTILNPNTIVRGETMIGEGCQIGPNTELVDAKIGDGAVIRHSVVIGRSVGKGDRIGPFSVLADRENNSKRKDSPIRRK